MKCPYCNEEMRAGYIQSANTIFFSENERILFYHKSLFNKKDISITYDFDHAAPACYCDTCNCLIWKKDLSEYYE